LAEGTTFNKLDANDVQEANKREDTRKDRNDYSRRDGETCIGDVNGQNFLSQSPIQLFNLKPNDKG